MDITKIFVLATCQTTFIGGIAILSKNYDLELKPKAGAKSMNRQPCANIVWAEPRRRGRRIRGQIPCHCCFRSTYYRVATFAEYSEVGHHSQGCLTALACFRQTRFGQSGEIVNLLDRDPAPPTLPQMPGPPLLIICVNFQVVIYRYGPPSPAILGAGDICQLYILQPHQPSLQDYATAGTVLSYSFLLVV